MVNITEEVNKEIVEYLNEYKSKLEEIGDTEEICYPIISLHLAAKKKILIKNLLLHPLVLKNINFYKNRKTVELPDLQNILANVLEFEMTSKETYLKNEELKAVIKVHKSLKKKSDKNAKRL